jgi:polar amino acid transport system substrate-binding protein
LKLFGREFNFIWSKTLSRVFVGLSAVVAVIVIISQAFQMSLAPSPYRVAIDPYWGEVDMLERKTNFSLFAENLLMEMGKRQGVRLKIIRVSFDQLIDGLFYETEDVSLRPMALTRKNLDRFAISDSFYDLGPVIVVKKGSDVKRVDDLNGKKVGVERNESDSLAVLSGPQVSIAQYPSEFEAIQALAVGEVDAVVTHSIAAYAYVNGYFRETLEVATQPLNDQALRMIAIRGGKTAFLVNEFNKALAEMRSDGTYDELKSKWNIP